MATTRAKLDNDLDMARNAEQRPLKEATKARLRQLIEAPDAQRWSACCNTVIAPGGMLDGRSTRAVTLWRAVCLVDPEFERSVRYDHRGDPIWTRIPGSDLLMRAIGYATH